MYFVFRENAIDNQFGTGLVLVEILSGIYVKIINHSIIQDGNDLLGKKYVLDLRLFKIIGHTLLSIRDK